MAYISFDTNLILDFFLKREFFAFQANKIISLALRGSIKGFVSAKSILDTHYILRKNIGNIPSQEALLTFCSWIEVIEVDKIKIVAALQKSSKDLEDQVQLQCALSRKNIKYLITRKVKDFKPDAITVLSPSDFLKIYERI